MGITWNPSRWKAIKDMPVYLDTSGATKVTTIKAGTVFTAFGVRAVVDANGMDGTWRSVLVSTGGLIPGESAMQRAILWCKDADFPDDSEPTNQAWDDGIWALAGNPAGRYPCPPEQDCPEPPDVSVIVADAIEMRDGEWQEWLLAGSPGQREQSTMAAPHED